MYNTTLSLTSAPDKGWWSMPRPGRFNPRQVTRYPLYRRLRGTQGQSEPVRKFSPPLGFDPLTFQSVTSRYTNWAVPALHYTYWAIPASINLYTLLISWQPYHLHVPIFLKSRSLSLLEPSGPVQACNGIALPLPLPFIVTRIVVWYT
jgi:hypothetical protein